ncbi:MAG: hypothetical protein PHG06_05955 [Parabacteroides sp.]|jgi:hypothetical protein|nr:hypothetical protein [Parabacteroides sp.]
MKTAYLIILTLSLGVACPLEVVAHQVCENVFSIKDKDPNTIEITAYDNKILVENAPIGSKLEIYSVVGIRVKEIIIKQSTCEYTVDIAKGYYIVRIGDTVRKIAIR